MDRKNISPSRFSLGHEVTGHRLSALSDYCLPYLLYSAMSRLKIFRTNKSFRHSQDRRFLLLFVVTLLTSLDSIIRPALSRSFSW